MDKTIAAIATPIGAGGIAVIRVSGSDAVAIADNVYRGKDRLSNAKSHTIHYGHIIQKDGDIIDEVLVSVMLAPRTFTREDVVEISTHGGVTASKSVLDRLMEAGAYPAMPGEFTKRAFLNGRIDLTQAEAVIDIINSKTELSQKNAVSQLEGSLSKKINALRESLVSLAAHMQVEIDYPDEELEDITTGDIKDTCVACKNEIDNLVLTSSSGKILREGISTVIVGKPNVGKSSLLNALAMQDRAIVTDIAGTTRDVIEEYIDMDGVMLKLLDTAGIHDTDDVVEKIGVEKSKKTIDEADLVLVMLDGTLPLSDDDRRILDITKHAVRIVLINKVDVGTKIDTIDTPTICVSVKTGLGIDKLKQKIKSLHDMGSIMQSDGAIITNMRHKVSLIHAGEALERAICDIDMGMPPDIVSIDLNLAMESLGEITGATVSEDIVQNIFHNFCVGK